MDTTAEIEIRLELAAEVELQLGSLVEVSLDCCVCQRIDRTVVFDLSKPTVSCTPTGHAFPGELVRTSISREGQVTLGMYSIRYQTGQFVDAKRTLPAVRHPTWGRIHFRMVCPQCSGETAGSVQNNQGQPWVEERCRCGAPLGAFDGPEFPILRAYTSDGEPLYEVTRSKYELFLGSVEQLSTSSRRLLGEIADISWTRLCELAAKGSPVYVQDKFKIDDPLRFSENLDRIVRSLRADRATFELRDTGRTIHAGA